MTTAIYLPKKRRYLPDSPVSPINLCSSPPQIDTYPYNQTSEESSNCQSPMSTVRSNSLSPSEKRDSNQSSEELESNYNSTDHTKQYSREDLNQHYKLLEHSKEEYFKNKLIELNQNYNQSSNVLNENYISILNNNEINSSVTLKPSSLSPNNVYKSENSESKECQNYNHLEYSMTHWSQKELDLSIQNQQTPSKRFKYADDIIVKKEEIKIEETHDQFDENKEFKREMNLSEVQDLSTPSNNVKFDVKDLKPVFGDHKWNQTIPQMPSKLEQNGVQRLSNDIVMIGDRRPPMMGEPFQALDLTVTSSSDRDCSSTLSSNNSIGDSTNSMEINSTSNDYYDSQHPHQPYQTDINKNNYPTHSSKRESKEIKLMKKSIDNYIENNQDFQHFRNLILGHQPSFTNANMKRYRNNQYEIIDENYLKKREKNNLSAQKCREKRNLHEKTNVCLSHYLILENMKLMKNNQYLLESNNQLKVQLSMIQKLIQ